jgi:predicted nuclease of predicted toxin-antitoxin system
MKLLLDSCIWGGTVKRLNESGYDVIWIGNWSQDPGDEEIIAYSYNEKRILITLDKDFGELAIVHEFPHCGIIRLVNFSVKDQASICMHILSLYKEELESGAIITAEPGRLRVRPH